MSTSYPGSKDNLTNPNPSDNLNAPSHSAQHANANDAIEAIESKLGTGAGSPTASNKYLYSYGTGLTTWGSASTAGLSVSGHTHNESDITNLNHYDSTDFNVDFGNKTLDNLLAGVTNKHFTTTDETKLDGIEALADVTSATNVAAAGAVMESDTSTANMDFVIDEDAMTSDSATKIPTQQSVKAYVDGKTVTPGGNDTEVQFNDEGTLGASSGFTYDKTSNSVSVANIAVSSVEAANVTVETNVVMQGVTANDYVSLSASSVNGTNTQTLQDADGVIALTSDINATNVDAAGALMKTQYADINRQGFTNLTETNIGFDGTNTFTLSSVGGTWTYYRAGVKYTVTGSKTVTLSATPPAGAAHYHIYIDDNIGTLTCSPIDWTLLDAKVPVASLYWNNTLTPKYWLVDERHTILIDSRMQYYLHATSGAKAVSIPTLADYTLNSDVNASKTFSISAGTLLDQDLKIDLAELTDPDGTATDYTVWYRTGASTWAWKKSNMPFVYNVGNTNDWIQWDNAGTMTDATGGAGGLTRWVNSYLLMTNIQGDSRYLLVPGRSIFSSLATAQAEDVASFSWTGLDIAEAVIAYKLTWSTVTSTSQGKCRLASVQKVNLSTATNLSSGAGTDHNTLSNLQGGTIGEYFHLTSAELSKLGGIETGADVTDATNVEAAGAVMESDTSTANMSFVVDEDDMVSDSNTKVPTQQSVKAYVAANVTTGGINQTIFDAKGDLITATAADTPARLAVSATDGHVLTVDAASAAGLKWAAPAGGGQTTYDAIVAATGGTHTTLGAALAAASSGWRILVADSTTETGNISSSLTNLTIYGAGVGNAVSMSNYSLTLSGAGLTMIGLAIGLSSTGLTISGANSKVVGCHFTCATYLATGLIKFNSSGGVFSSNTLISTSYAATYCLLYCGGTGNQTVTGNYISCPIKGDTSYGTVSITGSTTFTGNTIYGSADYNGNSAVALLATGSYNEVAGNRLSQMDIAQGVYLYNSSNNVITGNNIGNGGNYGVFCNANSNNNTITGNSIYANGGTGVHVQGGNTVVSGNFINSKSTGTNYAINLAGTNTGNVVSGNSLGGNLGIVISSGQTKVAITGNNFTNLGSTRVTDNSPGATVMSNATVNVLEEKRVLYMKNTSGGALAAGDVVVYKSVAAGDEVTTTTTAGDDKVFGMAVEAIGSNASGQIQTLGKTTLLKVNGTTDIAIGDYLTTYTTAAIAAKAAAGDMCFAIALEAYTTDDSSGVIDALLITPRLI